MKPIVTDTYDFPTLIGEGYVYVDKTALLRRMISGVDGRFFFMSRPRRFGKSLMISTLEQIFKGNRKLFKGLDIAKSDYDWKKYPVLRLDMSLFDNISGVEQFQRQVCAKLGEGQTIAEALEKKVSELVAQSEAGRIVVLVDEYDSPISGLIGRQDELERMRSLLQSFYRVLKSRAESIHFLMMTGVSKFTKLSVFSGMNNLTDLSMSPVYASLLGYTRGEIEQVFSPQVRAFAKQSTKSPKAIIEDLLAWYDSYRFSPESEVRVSNPVSVGRALQERRFYGFWNATGNASLIIERLRKSRKGPFDLEGLKVRPEQLDVCDAGRLPVEALLYQGGYLTIDHQDPSGLLSLRVPNREVRQMLDSGYVASVLRGRADDFENGAIGLVAELDSAEDVQRTIVRATMAIFAMVPHEWKLKSEAEAKRYFLLFMRMAGATINAEIESSNGRADAILETDKSVYIFEFKFNKSAKAAFKQIENKGYAKPYVADTRRIIAVGLNYTANSDHIDVVCGTVNGTVNANIGTVNGTVKTSQIFDLIKGHPGIRRPELQRLSGWSTRTLSRIITDLTGRIEFRGAPKTGGYYVIGDHHD